MGKTEYESVLGELFSYVNTRKEELTYSLPTNDIVLFCLLQRWAEKVSGGDQAAFYAIQNDTYKRFYDKLSRRRIAMVDYDPGPAVFATNGKRFIDSKTNKLDKQVIKYTLDSIREMLGSWLAPEGKP